MAPKLPTQLAARSAAKGVVVGEGRAPRRFPAHSGPETPCGALVRRRPQSMALRAQAQSRPRGPASAVGPEAPAQRGGVLRSSTQRLYGAEHGATLPTVDGAASALDNSSQ